jgi:DNA-binding MarR family transcriptional regulator
MAEQNQDCAARVIRTFPALMQAIVTGVESKGKIKLSFQQFRALMFIARHQNPNLSMVCDHLGATLSATSKLIDGLIQDGCVAGETAPDDRRIKLLSLTPSGKEEIQTHHQYLISSLAAKLDKLTESERAMVALAMDVLQSVLNPAPEGLFSRDSINKDISGPG